MKYGIVACDCVSRQLHKKNQYKIISPLSRKLMLPVTYMHEVIRDGTVAVPYD